MAGLLSRTFFEIFSNPQKLILRIKSVLKTMALERLSSNKYNLGAIQVDTNQYILPYKAEKGKMYKCPDCEQLLIFRKGNIRRAHFSHYSNTNICGYYSHPNESQLHKDAKHRFAEWLKDRKEIQISWLCCKNRYDGSRCKTFDGKMFYDIEYDNVITVITEYRDINNKYIADIALLVNNKIKYIFEIKHSHSTVNVRPEPWFEITTGDIFEIDNDIQTEEKIYLTCIRNNKNRFCSNCRILDENWVDNLPRLNKRMGVEKGWIQESPCIKCGRSMYSPVFVRGPRQICKLCLSDYEIELKKQYDKSDFSNWNFKISKIVNPELVDDYCF